MQNNSSADYISRKLLSLYWDTYMEREPEFHFHFYKTLKSTLFHTLVNTHPIMNQTTLRWKFSGGREDYSDAQSETETRLRLVSGITREDGCPG